MGKDRQALRAEKLHAKADQQARRLRLIEAAETRAKADRAAAKAARKGK